MGITIAALAAMALSAAPELLRECAKNGTLKEVLKSNAVKDAGKKADDYINYNDSDGG